MQRRGICFQRAKLYNLYWRRIPCARAEKNQLFYRCAILAPLLEML
jgi:hypothetical protein